MREGNVKAEVMLSTVVIVNFLRNNLQHAVTGWLRGRGFECVDIYEIGQNNVMRWGF
jgi:hypothetical protein